VYRTLAVRGPAHKPVFEVEVEWQGSVIASATGKSKKEAQQNCALAACKKLGVV
jgi:ribonuclease-3